MEQLTALINMFGPWGVVVLSLVWCAKFITEQLEAAQKERQALQQQHTDEMGKFTDIIQNNTEALNRLRDLMERKIDT